MCTPTGGSTYSFDGGVKTGISDQQFGELASGGASFNQVWKRRPDEAAPYLRQLKEAGVQVLFQPLHEMNESWNWWGAPPLAPTAAPASSRSTMTT
ncbi:glycosyl hydrolase [Streptomyces albidoflavus]